MQGWRSTMEDAAIYKLSLPVQGNKNLSLFAVFDGHGSNEVSEFCRDHMVSVLVQQPEFQSGQYSKALHKACIELDKLIKSPYGVNKLPTYQKPGSKSAKKLGNADGNQIAMIAGCAACIVLIDED